MGVLKGNHGNFLKAIKGKFQAQESVHTVEQGHGRVERRSVSVFREVDLLPGAQEWAALKTVIRVKRYRHILKGGYILIKKPTTHYYISSLDESAQDFGQRIREYWQVENKVHYVRDVTQGEDASRIRVEPLPNILAIARNLALNLYRDHGCTNMAQAQPKAGKGLNFLKSLFGMK